MLIGWHACESVPAFFMPYHICGISVCAKSVIFAFINLNKKSMNNINKEINRVIDTVIDCSKAVVSHEHMSVTKEEVMKKSKKENAFRVRCLIVYFLYKDGLSVTTIGMLLGRTSQSVRYKLTQHDELMKTSNIYRLVAAEIKEKLGDFD